MLAIHHIHGNVLTPQHKRTKGAGQDNNTPALASNRDPLPPPADTNTITSAGPAKSVQSSSPVARLAAIDMAALAEVRLMFGKIFSVLARGLSLGLLRPTVEAAAPNLPENSGAPNVVETARMPLAVVTPALLAGEDNDAGESEDGVDEEKRGVQGDENEYEDGEEDTDENIDEDTEEDGVKLPLTIQAKGAPVPAQGDDVSERAASPEDIALNIVV